MAAKKTSKNKSMLNFLPKNWQENYASFILGAIIVVILGLLVANFITNRNGGTIETEDSEQASSQEQLEQEANGTNGNQKEYKVQAGDSLSKIAEREYGDLEMWPVLVRANSIADPNIISVDQTINIPTKEEAGSIREQMTATSYEVQKGDTLFMVAEKMYGNGSRWGEIARANNVGTLPNGNPLIFEGSTLVIPR